MSDAIEDVLDKLAKNVEAAVHALYRGDMRQATAKVRTSSFVREAVEALRAQAAGSAAPPAPAPRVSAQFSAPSVAGASVGWTREDGEAVMKCVMAWLPMGSPSSAAPDSKCVAGGRDMVPAWGERERARAALKKITPS